MKTLKDQVDNCYAQDAIDWFEGRIEDSAMPFSSCCEILQAVLSEKNAMRTAINRNGSQLVIDPNLFALRIFNSPDKSISLMLMLKTMLMNGDYYSEDSAVEVDDYSFLGHVDDLKYYVDADSEADDEKLLGCLEDEDSGEDMDFDFSLDDGIEDSNNPQRIKTKRDNREPFSFGSLYNAKIILFVLRRGGDPPLYILYSHSYSHLSFWIGPITLFPQCRYFPLYTTINFVYSPFMVYNISI